jgi:hypothetical protein
MIAPRAFASVRSYYFRAHCAQIEREQREYGGRRLEDYGLDDFRILYAAATSQAVEKRRQANNRWDAQRKLWVQV